MSELYIGGNKVLETVGTVPNDSTKVPTCKAVNDLYVVAVKTSGNITLGPSASTSASIDVSMSGYTPILVSPRGLGTGGWSWSSCILDNDTTASITVNSFGYTGTKTTLATIYVLYKKNS